MRNCSHCGTPYLRVNTIDVWTIRMPGSRFGWVKEKVKLCNTCCSKRDTERMMLIVQPEEKSKRK